MEKTAVITGGAGFIGSALVHAILEKRDWRVVNIDKLAYSGNLASLAGIMDNPRHVFVQADIGDREAMRSVLERHEPDLVMNLAAESHVDRSIDDPAAFIETNIVGTFNLLEEARRYWKALGQKDAEKAARFRFQHISTDEVFGDLTENSAELFSEKTPYAPSSPYSASKASSDHLVRAWRRTYGLPTLVTNCSNNYGPRQFPEKLIPLMIINALAGKPLPVYGEGRQIRDWLYVEDHADALLLAAELGKSGETYAIGGSCEKRNIEVVEAVCDALDELAPKTSDGVSASYRSQIAFVKDRPGHDARYAIDASKIREELGWKPQENFASGIKKTVQWYLDNKNWWERILNGSYRCERLGVNV